MLSGAQHFPVRVRVSGEPAEHSGAECGGQSLPSGLGPETTGSDVDSLATGTSARTSPIPTSGTASSSGYGPPLVLDLLEAAPHLNQQARHQQRIASRPWISIYGIAPVMASNLLKVCEKTVFRSPASPLHAQLQELAEIAVRKMELSRFGGHLNMGRRRCPGGSTRL